MMSVDSSIDNQKVSGSVPAVADSGHVAVQFTDSNLHTFPPSETKGKISGAARPPRDADDTFSKPGGGNDEPQSGGWFRIFSVAAYKPYFDVDTSDVLERIKESLFPRKGSFTEMIADNPDLYGPFWICTTLIFIAASMGTFVTYMAHKLQSKDWNYDISLMTWSAGLFYGYVTLVPLCLYVILKYFSAPSGLVQLLCLYGYSLFVFIPALVSSLLITSHDVYFLIIGRASFSHSRTAVLRHLVSNLDPLNASLLKWILLKEGLGRSRCDKAGDLDVTKLIPKSREAQWVIDLYGSGM